jgi:ribose-phosphate pyrophosphokinase
VLVVSPDLGGRVRVKEFARLLKTDSIALKKHRDRKTGKVRILSEKVDVKDRDLIIVDDIISTGGSIVKATKFLKKQKCKRVFVACTHALLVNDAAKKIKNAGVSQIISTNTIPGESAKVDVSKVISDALK